MFRLITFKMCMLLIILFFSVVRGQVINKVTTTFPFSDDAEDTTASYANWTRDANV